MPFETFTGKRVVTKEPRISIIKQGHFSFNTGAMQVLKNKAATHLQSCSTATPTASPSSPAQRMPKVPTC